MRQVFRTRPWIPPREPERFVRIFRRYGEERVFDKEMFLDHGGEDGEIALLLEGLASFSFVGNDGQLHIFALITPGRTIGDLDALNPHRVNVLAECLRKSRCLVIRRSQWLPEIRSSIDNMEVYADLSILKEESALEGTFANFILDLDSRLRVLLLSIFQSYGIDVRKPGLYRLPLSLTITEISKIVASNRSWVSSKISEWSDSGLIVKSGRTIACRSSLFDSVMDWMHGGDNIRPSSLDTPDLD